MARKRGAVSDSASSAASSDSYQPVRPRRGRASKRAKRGAGEPGVQDDEAGDAHAAAMHVVGEPAPVRAALLEWYARVRDARGMPWRKPYRATLTADGRAQRAYEVWISEIMLQQTQVATVIPYYNTWMARFPTIRDLAASDIETVNSLWKGLGYYSRAARLLSGAKKAVAQFAGRLPDNAHDMERHIPGIGRYSAGAICSIAYNQCVPVLDGNVHRLLSRLLALHAPPKGKQALDILWAGATDLVDGCERPGDLNQALIELGATVCKVRDPQCGTCPVRPWCRAFNLQNASDTKGPPATEASNGIARVGDIEELCALCEALPAGSPVTRYPMKAAKKQVREELDVVNVVEWRRDAAGARWFLLVRRPEHGLLAGLHEFPTASNVPAPALPAELPAIARTLLARLLAVPPAADAARAEDARALRIVKTEPAGDVVHVFSHIRKTYRVQWVVLEGGGAAPPGLASGGPGPRAGSKKASGARRRAAPGADAEVPVPVPVQAMWMRMDDVVDANVGTGVLKVWNQARRLWGDGV